MRSTAWSPIHKIIPLVYSLVGRVLVFLGRFTVLVDKLSNAGLIRFNSPHELINFPFRGESNGLCRLNTGRRWSE